MQHIGHPLAADPIYGARPKISSPKLHQGLHAFNRQALHAVRLGLIHPVTGEYQQWECPLPDDFKTLLAVMTEDFYDFNPDYQADE